MKVAAILVTCAGLFLAPDPPAAPTGLAATPGNAQVALDWKDNSPAVAGYNVYRAATSGGTYSKVNTSLLTTSAFTNTGLVNGTPYFYVVRAQNSAQQESANSSEVAATPNGTDTTAPAPPVITSSTRKTKDATPSTSGTAEPGSTVRVYAGSTEVGNTTAAPNGTWTVANPSSLGADGFYTITARATDAAANQSNPSGSITITLDTTPPEAPTNIRVMPTIAFIDVEWTASTSSDVAGYRVYRQTDGGSWTLLNSMGLVLITKYRDSAVSAGHNYNYRITAVDDALAD